MKFDFLHVVSSRPSAYYKLFMVGRTQKSNYSLRKYAPDSGLKTKLRLSRLLHPKNALFDSLNVEKLRKNL